MKKQHEQKLESKGQYTVNSEKLSLIGGSSRDCREGF